MTIPVSVIVPVFNGEAFVEGALDCLRNQRYRPLEIIVIDDGSTDRTAQIVQQHSDVIYVHQSNAGPSVARNQGLRLASAPYITFLDVDDRYPEGKIAFQANYLDMHPDLEVVMGGIKYVLLDGIEPTGSPMDSPDSMRAFVNLGAGMFRRAVFERIGHFAEDLRFSEDVDWFFRALEQDIRLSIIKEPGLLYQRHAQGMTSAAGDQPMRLHFLRVLRRSMERRRQPNGSLRPLPEWTSYFEDSLKQLTRDKLTWTEP